MDFELFHREEPYAKKRKESLPSSSLGAARYQGEKVCIVCCCNPGECTDGEPDSYRIYVVDLGADDTDYRSFKPTVMPPTFRLGPDCLIQAFCVLGSTLYLFDQFHPRTNPKGGRSVYTYELPSNVSSVSNLRLEREMLVKIPPMLRFKMFPIAIPTPDMKSILVFSSRIIQYPYAARDPTNFDDLDFCDLTDSDFEIYYPDGDGGRGSWHKFAGIPISWKDSEFYITTYTFMDNQHVLLLQTDTDMMFTLDLRFPHQPCRRFAYGVPDAPGLIPEGGYFILVGGYLYLTPNLPFDKDETGYFDYPELSSLGHKYGHQKYTLRSRRINLLSVDNNECKFCIIQTEMNRETLRPYLTVNVYKLDLEEYEKRKGKKIEDQVKNHFEDSPLPATDIIKSFKFRLNIEGTDDCFLPIGLFSVQQRTDDKTLWSSYHEAAY